MSRSSQVMGVGSYLPRNMMTNHDLSKTLETTHEWIVERTGIHQRHIAAPGELTSDLAFEASKRALEASHISAEEIDLIILATSTPDNTFPATSVRLQAKLGITKGFAFDIGAACSGFIFALATADLYIRQGLAQTALVVGAETMSRIVDWQDRRAAILFGDGAGALVLKAAPLSSTKGILETTLHSDGKGYDLLYVSGGPSTSQTSGTITMNGRDVFRHAVQRLGEVTEELLEKRGLSSGDIDWFVPHQANRRIIDATAQRLGLPDSKIIHTGSHHGNTSAASIPLALDVGIQDGRIKPGHLILSEAFGGGFTWGASLFRL